MTTWKDMIVFVALILGVAFVFFSFSRCQVEHLKLKYHYLEKVGAPPIYKLDELRRK